MVTADVIQLRSVALDAPGQLTRGVGRRLVWRWVCPGPHAHPMEVVAREDEPRDLQTEAAILADPYCHYCRREREARHG